MSGTEATILVSAVVVIWGLESIRQTLKECLTVLKQNSEKIRSDLLAIQNEIRMK
ncbi:MAG TPA: hypothetical protein VOA64_09410 [Candidatus Dormibacteraeota bacterium]|nr:hypothetical protein [Candidatus Dormibacteraeota bacterium]